MHPGSRKPLREAYFSWREVSTFPTPSRRASRTNRKIAPNQTFVPSRCKSLEVTFCPRLQLSREKVKSRRAVDLASVSCVCLSSRQQQQLQWQRRARARVCIPSASHRSSSITEFACYLPAGHWVHLFGLSVEIKQRKFLVHVYTYGRDAKLPESTPRDKWSVRCASLSFSIREKRAILLRGTPCPPYRAWAECVYAAGAKRDYSWDASFESKRSACGHTGKTILWLVDQVLLDLRCNKFNARLEYADRDSSNFFVLPLEIYGRWAFHRVNRVVFVISIVVRYVISLISNDNNIDYNEIRI